MKITCLKTQCVTVPLSRPITTAIHDMKSAGCVLVRLTTDTELEGQGFVFTLNGDRLKVFEEMIKGFASFVIGKDPHFVSGIWQSIWQEINPAGHKGVTISALSAIDTALWDLVGKAANLPLHHLFGACRESIDTYASSGLWLSQDIDNLKSEAEGFLSAGFKSMKIRVGKDSLDEDISRAAAVRQTIGPEHGLLADANQALTPKQAIRMGKALDEFDLTWFEEPVAADDLDGHAEVRTNIPMPLASGETEYTAMGMKDMIEKRACDILMPDLQRIGGLTEMRRTAALASVHHLPISTHFFTQHSLSIAGSAPNCISIEHIDWFTPLFREEMELDGNGRIVVPNRPGTGFTFDETRIESLRT